MPKNNWRNFLYECIVILFYATVLMASSVSYVVAEEVVPPTPAPSASTKESTAEALEGKESLVLESQLKLAVEVHRQWNMLDLLMYWVWGTCLTIAKPR